MTAKNIDSDVEVARGETADLRRARDVPDDVRPSLIGNALVVPGSVDFDDIREEGTIFENGEIPPANACNDLAPWKTPRERLEKRSRDKQVTNVVISQDEDRGYFRNRPGAAREHSCGNAQRHVDDVAFPSHGRCGAGDRRSTPGRHGSWGKIVA